jgi:tetratricopeptide (TPR) repeat protein
MIQIPGCNMALAQKMLALKLETLPDSFIYLFIEAKSLQSAGKPKESIQVLTKIVNVAKDWRQLAHACFFDMGICYISLGEWENAIRAFGILYEENKWSKAVYLYLKAVCLYALDPLKNLNEVTIMFKQVPSLCKKVSGKSIPIEKWVSRKSRKFALQENRLLFPAYEILYMVFIYNPSGQVSV